MEREVLRVQMFGKFSLTYADRSVDGGNKRSKLIWNILSYLLNHRHELVSAEELISALWKPEKNDNPAGAMRTAIHRVRAMLHDLMPDVSTQFIVSKNGGYMWDPSVPVIIDSDEFDKLVGAHKSAAAALSDYLAALELYDGKFLSAQSEELWVMPIQTYYHNIYDDVVDKVVVALEQEGRFAEGVSVCRKALRIDPYSEKNNQHLMRLLLQMGQREEVVRVYEDMSKLLMSVFGVMPDHESRALYREALTSVKNGNVISPEAAVEQLSEQGVITGAIVCDYDFFKLMYQAQARMIMRSGTVVHTALVTLQSRKESDVSQKSMTMAMDRMELHLKDSLRKGDIITRCSASQFMVMLLAANYEDSCKVCKRVISNFVRKYPHSPVQVDHFVQALLPSSEK